MATDYKIETDEGIYEFIDCEPERVDASFDHAFGTERLEEMEKVKVGAVCFAPYNNADPSSGQLGESEQIEIKEVSEEALSMLHTEVQQDYANGDFE